VRGDRSIPSQNILDFTVGRRIEEGASPTGSQQRNSRLERDAKQVGAGTASVVYSWRRQVHELRQADRSLGLEVPPLVDAAGSVQLPSA